ncbi:hypothetical protein ACFYM5_30645 [Streptomyces sp. NPDC006706]
MHNPYSGAMITATNMTVAMSAWMRFRGHRRRPIVEMGAAVYVPFLVLFVPLAFELRRQYSSGLPPLPSSHAGHGSTAAMTCHSTSVVSEV